MKYLRNEKGFAMVFVLVLAAISLAMTLAMLIDGESRDRSSPASRDDFERPSRRAGAGWRRCSS